MLQKIIAFFLSAERRKPHADFYARFPRPGAPVRSVTERESMETLDRAIALAKLHGYIPADNPRSA